MKARKPIIIFLILISIFVLGGCASQDKGPRKLWDKYVAGMNKKSIEEVKLQLIMFLKVMVIKNILVIQIILLNLMLLIQ